MTATLTPYLTFRDRAREALDFYRSVLGGDYAVQTFAEYGASPGTVEGDRVMHAVLTTEAGLTVMVADSPDPDEPVEGSAVSLALFGDDEPRLRGYWQGLSDGATVVVPFEPAPWGDVYGQLVDRFGVQWMVNVSAPAA